MAILGRPKIVAAMVPTQSNAAFNRGNLIIRLDAERLLEVRTYRTDGQADGPPLSQEDLGDLIATGHASSLPHASAEILRPAAALWVLRSKFPRRDQALNSLHDHGLLCCSPFHHPNGAIFCITIENEQAAAIRGIWRSDAIDATLHFLRAMEWTSAVAEAQFALEVACKLDPEVLGILSLAYALSGRDQRAEGLFIVARRSRGQQFESQVRKARLRYEANLG